ncbi:MAG: hypothetical protein OSA97_09530 [Nevskia sp.]|nr:hypothetical protein [Nevskia sp.]
MSSSPCNTPARKVSLLSLADLVSGANNLVFLNCSLTKYQLLQRNKRRINLAIESAGNGPAKTETGSPAKEEAMDTPALLMVNVVLWSTGLSVAVLAALLGLDWLENRRTQLGTTLQSESRANALMQKRLQQPVAPRRRAAAKQMTVKAA